MAGVFRRALARSVGGIEDTARADLHKQFSFVAVLLDDPVVVAPHPDVVVRIERAPVDGVWNHVRIAPRRDHLSGDIEHDDRRSLLRGLGLLGGNVAAIHHYDVIVRIRAYASQLPGDPAFRQRLRPGRIDGVMGSWLCVQCEREQATRSQDISIHDQSLPPTRMPTFLLFCEGTRTYFDGSQRQTPF